MSADTGARERAFVEWCERADYTPDDRDAPHAEAFFAGFDVALAAGVGVPPDAGRIAELVSALRQARANHLGDQRIANEMVNHFPVEIRCDHDTNRDKVICDCARVDLGWHPSVRAAKEAWAAHVIEAVKGARAQAGVGEARPAEPRGTTREDMLKDTMRPGREPGQPQAGWLATWATDGPHMCPDRAERRRFASEYDALREQLDAAREALAATRLDAEKTYAWRERFEERAIRAEAELRMVEARAASVAETMKGRLP